MPEVVRCYAGSTYPERPRSFTWMDETYEVKAVSKSWRSPNGKHFRVRTNADETFDLFYNEQSKTWQIKKL